MPEKDYVEAWVCDQPPPSATYRVIRDRWVEDYTIRVIYEIEIIVKPAA